jgi:antitoxin (DNA-binding transcriptional repressor) of toxin-antitoxin stability system
MPSGSSGKTAIGVTAFKAQCLGLIDDVAQGKTERIVLLKHNRPIAAIVPIQKISDTPPDLWGAMRGTVTVAPGVDLTESTGENWDAEQ